MNKNIIVLHYNRMKKEQKQKENLKKIFFSEILSHALNNFFFSSYRIKDIL